ncbi:hypothetical protein [Streptomyces sp. NPDC001546]|uniref:hypothetical protein n=1 Tax=Streptomyces sp. NPDC001546 TaxID=3364585 RepID=UPI0036CEC6FD
MHEPARPSTTTPARYGDPLYRPTPIQQPVMLPGELPPGVEIVTLPGGYRTLAYTDPATPSAAAPAVQTIPRWAKTTALLAPTLGGGIAAAGFGISYAAPGVLAMADALWAAVALIATGALAPLAFKVAWGSGGGRQAAPVQHITQNISATGLFGKATGTLNHR